MFRGFGTYCMVPSDWDLAPKVRSWSQFQIFLIAESPIFSDMRIEMLEKSLESSWNSTCRTLILAWFPSGASILGKARAAPIGRVIGPYWCQQRDDSLLFVCTYKHTITLLHLSSTWRLGRDTNQARRAPCQIFELRQRESDGSSLRSQVNSIFADFERGFHLHVRTMQVEDPGFRVWPQHSEAQQLPKRLTVSKSRFSRFAGLHWSECEMLIFKIPNTGLQMASKRRQMEWLHGRWTTYVAGRPFHITSALKHQPQCFSVSWTRPKNRSECHCHHADRIIPK